MRFCDYQINYPTNSTEITQKLVITFDHIVSSHAIVS